MEKFLEKIADILEVEVEDITMSTNFREEIEDWSSMMGFSILVLLEDDYDTRLSMEDFMGCETISDLYNAIKNKR